jgi:DNA-binding PadR family transcriptional regulator
LGKYSGELDMTPSSHDPERFLPLTPIAFEILLALAEGPRHGYDVMLGIERRTSGRLVPNPGTLYRALDRLVREGLLESMPGDGGAGEPRRQFKLTRLGARVAEAEATRLADQVGAARSLGVLKGRG